jgi:hypothetical protein
MPGKIDSDYRRMVVDHAERLDALEKQEKTDHARIEVLEKHATNMSSLPATVAALGQKVESSEKAMIREVDGLRAQQKAHKEETARRIEDGFNQMGSKINEVSKSVKDLEVTKVVQKAWWQVLEKLGQIAVGAALFMEGCKIFFGH